MARGKKRASTRGARKTSTSRRASSSRAGSSSSRGSSKLDAIALLKADHRQVEQWFEQFESTRSADRKKNLAAQICQALTVHAKIEEEIFYPAFLEATGEEDIHHEAEVEHNGAKNLIAQIEGSRPDDDYYDAKVTVLSEMIKHHVKEEEQRDGMFAKARAAGMDLQALGEQLAARKAELMSEGPAGASSSRRSRDSRAQSAAMMARST